MKLTRNDVIATCLMMYRHAVHQERKGAVLHELGEGFHLTPGLKLLFESQGYSSVSIGKIIDQDAAAVLNDHLDKPNEKDETEALPFVRAMKVLAFAATFAGVLPVTKQHVEAGIEFINFTPKKKRK